MTRALTSWPLERVVGLGILTVALMFTLGLGVLTHLGQQTLAWPVTTGVVMDSRLSRSRSNGYDRFSAHIMYAYRVNGHTYHSSRVSYRSTQADEGTVRTVLNRYPPGHAVQVHYDPRAPTRAVLEPGTDVVILGALAVTTTAAFIGAGVFVSTLPPVATWLDRHQRSHSRRPVHPGRRKQKRK